MEQARVSVHAKIARYSNYPETAHTLVNESRVLAENAVWFLILAAIWGFVIFNVLITAGR